MPRSRKSNQDQPDHWLDQAKQLALANWKDTLESDGSAIYLVDPQVRQRVHQYLIAEVWSTARITLNARGFDLLNADEPMIHDEWQNNVCASAKLIIIDPEKPRAIGEPALPWFCRMSVEARSDQSRVIRDELFLHLSLRTDVDLLADLVRSTTNAEGLPTRLSFEESSSGDDIWIIAFEHGAGDRGGCYDDHQFPEVLRQRLFKYCDFIELANQLVGAPNNALIFQKLAAHVNDLFRPSMN